MPAIIQFVRALYRSLLVLVLVLMTACSKPNGTSEEFQSESPLSMEGIKGSYYIAIAAPLTGPYKALGQGILEGATLAVEEFNKKQDANHKIGTLILDDGGLVAEGLGRADIAIAQGVLGVIGHLNSEISLETSYKYSAAHIPQISPASTHPKFTETPRNRGYVFRTIGTDLQLSARAAQYANSQTQIKKIAVLYNDRPYGISVSSAFISQIRTDKTIVFNERIPVRTSDHSATVARLDELDPDLVFFVGEYNDAGYLLKALKAKIPKLQFLAVEGVHDKKFISIAGKASEGALVLGTSCPDEIRATYLERYKKEPSAYVATSYLATQLLVQAAQRNSFKSGSNLAKELKASQFFLPNGDLKTPNFVLYRVHKGHFVQE